MLQLSEIKKDYYDVVSKMEERIKFGLMNSLPMLKTFFETEIEFNCGEKLPQDIKDISEINSIRIETFGCLNYVYFYFENGKITHIIFDVEEPENEEKYVPQIRIYDTMINYLDKEYEISVKSVEKEIKGTVK